MAILEKRQWCERRKGGNEIYNCKGYFLFGRIPLYVMRIITTRS